MRHRICGRHVSCCVKLIGKNIVNMQRETEMRDRKILTEFEILAPVVAKLELQPCPSCGLLNPTGKRAFSINLRPNVLGFNLIGQLQSHVFSLTNPLLIGAKFYWVNWRSGKWYHFLLDDMDQMGEWWVSHTHTHTHTRIHTHTHSNAQTDL